MEQPHAAQRQHYSAQAPGVTLALLKDAAAQAGHIRRELAAIKASALDQLESPRNRTLLPQKTNLAALQQASATSSPAKRDFDWKIASSQDEGPLLPPEEPDRDVDKERSDMDLHGSKIHRQTSMASAAAVAPGEQQAPPQDDDSLDQHRRSLQRSLEQHYSRPDEHLQHRSPSYMRESFAPMNTHHMHSVKPARAQHKVMQDSLSRTAPAPPLAERPPFDHRSSNSRAVGGRLPDRFAQTSPARPGSQQRQRSLDAAFTSPRQHRQPNNHDLGGRHSFNDDDQNHSHAREYRPDNRRGVHNDASRAVVTGSQSGWSQPGPHSVHSMQQAPDRQQSETMNEMRNRLIARMQQANEAKMRVDDRKRQTKRTTKPATLQLPSAFEPAVWKCSISPNSSPKAAENRERARAYADTLKASRSLPASRDHTPKKLRDAGPAGPAATHLAASLPATPRQDRPGWGSQRKPQRLTRQVSQPRHTFDWEKELRSPRMPSPNKPLTGWETNEPDQGPMMFRRGWTPDRSLQAHHLDNLPDHRSGSPARSPKPRLDESHGSFHHQQSASTAAPRRAGVAATAGDAAAAGHAGVERSAAGPVLKTHVSLKALLTQQSGSQSADGPLTHRDTGIGGLSAAHPGQQMQQQQWVFDNTEDESQAVAGGQQTGPMVYDVDTAARTPQPRSASRRLPSPQHPRPAWGANLAAERPQRMMSEAHKWLTERAQQATPRRHEEAPAVSRRMADMDYGRSPRPARGASSTARDPSVPKSPRRRSPGRLAHTSPASGLPADPPVRMRRAISAPRAAWGSGPGSPRPASGSAAASRSAITGGASGSSLRPKSPRQRPPARAKKHPAPDGGSHVYMVSGPQGAGQEERLPWSQAADEGGGYEYDLSSYQPATAPGSNRAGAGLPSDLFARPMHSKTSLQELLTLTMARDAAQNPNGPTTAAQATASGSIFSDGAAPPAGRSRLSGSSPAAPADTAPAIATASGGSTSMATPPMIQWEVPVDPSPHSGSSTGAAGSAAALHRKRSAPAGVLAVPVEAGMEAQAGPLERGRSASGAQAGSRASSAESSDLTSPADSGHASGKKRSSWLHFFQRPRSLSKDSASKPSVAPSSHSVSSRRVDLQATAESAPPRSPASYSHGERGTIQLEGPPLPFPPKAERGTLLLHNPLPAAQPAPASNPEALAQSVGPHNPDHAAETGAAGATNLQLAQPAGETDTSDERPAAQSRLAGGLHSDVQREGDAYANAAHEQVGGASSSTPTASWQPSEVSAAARRTQLAAQQGPLAAALHAGLVLATAPAAHPADGSADKPAATPAQSATAAAGAGMAAEASPLSHADSQAGSPAGGDAGHLPALPAQGSPEKRQQRVPLHQQPWSMHAQLIAEAKSMAVPAEQAAASGEVPEMTSSPLHNAPGSAVASDAQQAEQVQQASMQCSSTGVASAHSAAAPARVSGQENVQEPSALQPSPPHAASLSASHQLESGHSAALPPGAPQAVSPAASHQPEASNHAEQARAEAAESLNSSLTPQPRRPEVGMHALDALTPESALQHALGLQATSQQTGPAAPPTALPGTPAGASPSVVSSLEGGSERQRSASPVHSSAASPAADRPAVFPAGSRAEPAPAAAAASANAQQDQPASADVRHHLLPSALPEQLAVGRSDHQALPRLTPRSSTGQIEASGQPGAMEGQGRRLPPEALGLQPATAASGHLPALPAASSFGHAAALPASPAGAGTSGAASDDAAHHNREGADGGSRTATGAEQPACDTAEDDQLSASILQEYIAIASTSAAGPEAARSASSPRNPRLRPETPLSDVAGGSLRDDTASSMSQRHAEPDPGSSGRSWSPSPAVAPAHTQAPEEQHQQHPPPVAPGLSGAESIDDGEAASVAGEVPPMSSTAGALSPATSPSLSASTSALAAQPHTPALEVPSDMVHGPTSSSAAAAAAADDDAQAAELQVEAPGAVAELDAASHTVETAAEVQSAPSQASDTRPVEVSAELPSHGHDGEVPPAASQASEAAETQPTATAGHVLAVEPGQRTDGSQPEAGSTEPASAPAVSDSVPSPGPSSSPAAPAAGVGVHGQPSAQPTRKLEAVFSGKAARPAQLADKRMSEHPIGSLLLQDCPDVGTMTGAQLLAALSAGTEMHKAWEQGAGGSTRLMQCTLVACTVYLAYSSGWRRKSMKHAVDRVHVPAGEWQPSKTISIDTDKGTIGLVPPSAHEYATWVCGLNAAITAAKAGQDGRVGDMAARDMLWNKSLFEMI